jgi:3'-phosphoadenosine 5'-phosphosulfate sulfotransferase (PAPS reductase)/FAD synthetase
VSGRQPRGSRRKVDPTIEVVFIDTGYHCSETLETVVVMA